MTERPPARTHRLELVALGADGWRLCDRSVPVDDATHVIAYVEQVERGFEVVWLNCLHGTSTFATMDEVFHTAHSLLAQAETSGPQRPVPIAHFAPPSG